MTEKYNAVYDECMYPLSGESEADFSRRLAVMRENRKSKITGKGKKIAKALVDGVFTSDMLEELEITDDLQNDPDTERE